jgi:hypothetical protein
MLTTLTRLRHLGGIPPGTTIASAAQLLAVVPAALLISVLLAAVPGRNAGRIPPGRALRSE